MNRNLLPNSKVKNLILLPRRKSFGFRLFSDQHTLHVPNQSPPTWTRDVHRRMLFLLFLLLVSVSSFAQITGKAFRDYNQNGTQEGGEPGVGNIIVKFYTNALLPSKDQLLGQVTTSSTGSYTYTPAAYPVRIEFEVPTGFCNLSPTEDFPANNGQTYGTSVQFAKNAGTYNFIINYPIDFFIRTITSPFTRI